jgi:hypothetical protein
VATGLSPPKGVQPPANAIFRVPNIRVPQNTFIIYVYDLGGGVKLRGRIVIHMQDLGFYAVKNNIVRTEGGVRFFWVRGVRRSGWGRVRVPPGGCRSAMVAWARRKDL